MDAERYGRGRVPRGRSLTSGYRAVWERACTEGAESYLRMQDVWERACTEGAESYLRMRGGLGGGVHRGGGVLPADAGWFGRGCVPFLLI